MADEKIGGVFVLSFHLDTGVSVNIQELPTTIPEKHGRCKLVWGPCAFCGVPMDLDFVRDEGFVQHHTVIDDIP